MASFGFPDGQSGTVGDVRDSLLLSFLFLCHSIQRLIHYRHCHIAWHASGGLGVTFLERAAEFSEAVPQADVDALNEQCSSWNDYFPSQDPFGQEDSGI